MSTLNRCQQAPVSSFSLKGLGNDLLVSRRRGKLQKGQRGTIMLHAKRKEDRNHKEKEKQSLLLLGTGDMLFHIVKCILGDSFLKNKIL